MKIIESKDFDSYWKKESIQSEDLKTEKVVRNIIGQVRKNGDAAVRKFASKFDKSSPQKLEVPLSCAVQALDELRKNDSALTEALELAAQNIMSFSVKQREQFKDFEYEIDKGVITGQRIIPVQRCAVYIPGGRFPLFSSVLMCMIPAFCAGVEEVILSSPPMLDGFPDKRTLAAAAIAAKACGISLDTRQQENRLRIFSIGGAQAIAALALGTETVPRVDVIAGPGNKFVATAKKILFGQVGIDFIAGPTDVLIIAEPKQTCQTADSKCECDMEKAANLVAADMLAQAEHDPDARARALVPDKDFAQMIANTIEERIENLSTIKTAKASLDNGGLIIVYNEKEEAIRIANTIAAEHLELHLDDYESWIPFLKNYGSLFIGCLSAEVLGDYSAGINHTLPTSASARFTGGLSVRHFLKTVTSLRCNINSGYEKICHAAEIIGKAEGLDGHSQSAAVRNSVRDSIGDSVRKSN